MILFVDDMAEREALFRKRFPEKAPDTVFVKTSEEACFMLMSSLCEFDTVWLDHDAGCMWAQPNGLMSDRIHLTFRPVACILAAMKFGGVVKLHSANAPGRAWMQALLEEHGVKVENNTGADVNHLYGST